MVRGGGSSSVGATTRAVEEGSTTSEEASTSRDLRNGGRGPLRERSGPTRNVVEPSSSIRRPDEADSSPERARQRPRRRRRSEDPTLVAPGTMGRRPLAISCASWCVLDRDPALSAFECMHTKKQKSTDPPVPKTRFSHLSLSWDGAEPKRASASVRPSWIASCEKCRLLSREG